MKKVYRTVPHFSLIIPAFNEEAYLTALLDSVDVARTCYRGTPADIEVVVVDNASTDSTAELARSRGCRVFEEDRRVIAAVRNTGARNARGHVLVFVDADNSVHPDTFNAIDRSLSSGKVIAGATGVTMQRWSLGIAITYVLMVPITWLTRMDTGVVFCSREDFEAIGGYNEDLLFAEDVQLLWDLMRRGRKRGQKLSRITSARAIFSTRKFDRHGDWHYFWMVLRILYGWLFSRSYLDDFTRMYWYPDRRTKNSSLSSKTEK